MVNESLTAELERYKEQVAIFEQKLNVDLNKREKFIDSQMDDLIRDRNAKLVAFQQEIDTLKETLSNNVKENESLSKTLTIQSRRGINKCIRAVTLLRYFDLGKMELENSQNNALAKLPILKLGVFEMWEIRIKQYFQIQDYALWVVNRIWEFSWFKRICCCNYDDKTLGIPNHLQSSSSTYSINTAKIEFSTGNSMHEGKEDKFYENMMGNKLIIDGNSTRLDMTIQGNSSKKLRIEDASEEAMWCYRWWWFYWAVTGRGREIKANMLSLAFSDSEMMREKLSLPQKSRKEKTYATKESLLTLSKQSRRTFRLVYEDGLRNVKNAKTSLFVRSVNTARPISTARGCSKAHVWKIIAQLSVFKKLMEVMLLPFGGGRQMEDESLQWFAGTFSNVLPDGTHDDCSFQDDGIDDHQVNTASPQVNTGSRVISTAAPEVNTATSEGVMEQIPTTEDIQVEDQDIELGNISPSYEVSSTPHTRLHKDHPIDHVIGDVQSSVQTRRMTTSYSETQRVCQKLLVILLGRWLCRSTHTMFMLQNVWVLVDLPKGHRAIGTKWVYRNKKDKRGIVFWVLKLDLIALMGHYKSRRISSDGALWEELTFFLGFCRLSTEEEMLFISQDKYVHEILKKFNYTDVKSASTPTDLEKPLVKDADADDVDEHLYRSMIGSLMYLTASRPDIMFAVCACARFQVSPKTSHLLAVKRIFRYLKGKPSLGLWYSKDSPLELVAYTDSDYAGATLDRKSTTGGCQFLGNRLISWQCKKQTVVATSTTEAEYVAAASCCGQVLWIQNQLLDYGYNFMNTVIYIDNTSTICIIENPVQHSKTKHIEIRHHFIRDCNTKKLIQMAKIDTQLNVADLLTKGFDAGRFQYLVSSIGMLNP
ncbi:hypothetical protein Tco_0411097 [Tanacetum coccineum]